MVGAVAEWLDLPWAQESRGEPRLLTVNLAQVQERTVEFLWDGRIPQRKITFLDGDPGVCKTALYVDLVARLTRGREMPFGSSCRAANVLIATTEDDAADTLVPRLRVAGADLARVRYVTGVDGGKKIGWKDAVRAILVIGRERFRR